MSISKAMSILKVDLVGNAAKTTPLGRLGQPEDIGKIAVFFAYDDANWVTGQTIMAGGGTTW